MVKIVKSCIQSSLKIVNLALGIVGIAMILYSLWMIRAWQRDMERLPIDLNSSFPWFIHVFLGIGITLCAVTCLGHIAADTANAYCLSCYMLTIFLFILLETFIIADVLLNSDWEKDLPDDPSGRFDDFKEFVESNFDICKWIGLLVILAQGFSILLATVMRTLQRDRATGYDSDEDYPPPRLPLLSHHAPPPPYVVGEPHFAPRPETWKINK